MILIDFDGEEVLEVLKSVRLTANFPQIIFLLAFDADRLVDELADS